MTFEVKGLSFICRVVSEVWEINYTMVEWRYLLYRSMYASRERTSSIFTLRTWNKLSIKTWIWENERKKKVTNARYVGNHEFLVIESSWMFKSRVNTYLLITWTERTLLLYPTHLYKQYASFNTIAKMRHRLLSHKESQKWCLYCWKGHTNMPCTSKVYEGTQGEVKIYSVYFCFDIYPGKFVCYMHVASCIEPNVTCHIVLPKQDFSFFVSVAV